MSTETFISLTHLYLYWRNERQSATKARLPVNTAKVMQADYSMMVETPVEISDQEEDEDFENDGCFDDFDNDSADGPRMSLFDEFKEFDQYDLHSLAKGDSIYPTNAENIPPEKPQSLGNMSLSVLGKRKA